MRCLLLSVAFVLVVTVPAVAQEATTTSIDAPSRTSAIVAATTSSRLDVEDERARCFHQCYRQYGDYSNCPLPEDQFLGCWCSTEDWTEREEDCVWDECGVDAHNEYGDTLRRICETVSFPPYLTSTRSSTGFPDTFASSTSAEEDSSQETAGVTTTRGTDDDAGFTTTTLNNAPTTTDEEGPEETPNSGNMADWSWEAGALAGAAYILRMVI
ncbi:hypothetical protein HJFPF1_11404 [Paramyrothecium foliicola]|nr:hypothetical protein HJFPF1_11404 [Paramyrothecium foliicola]